MSCAVYTAVLLSVYTQRTDTVMRLKFWKPAGTVSIPGKGEFPERYASDAFNQLIGQDVPFKIEGVERGRAVVVAVEVAEDGSGAEWTVDYQPEGAD